VAPSLWFYRRNFRQNGEASTSEQPATTRSTHHEKRKVVAVSCFDVFGVSCVKMYKKKRRFNLQIDLRKKKHQQDGEAAASSSFQALASIESRSFLAIRPSWQPYAVARLTRN